MYKHYSFDLWMTLIRSNPSFKQERTKFFYDHFNHKKKSKEEILAVFRRVDMLANALNERTGNSIGSEELHLMVVSAINDDDNSVFRDLDPAKLYEEMEALQMRYPPIFFCDDTPKVLSRLKQQDGETGFSLMSNTAFTKGKSLRKILDRLGLEGFFDFQLYSDEEGWSKPNERLFRLMLDRIAGVRNAKGKEAIGLKEIVHVGDNERADIGGANAIGISGVLINSNGKTILDLIDQ
jgi:putative hydrolase of the HAD superfamily